MLSLTVVLYGNSAFERLAGSPVISLEIFVHSKVFSFKPFVLKVCRMRLYSTFELTYIFTKYHESTKDNVSLRVDRIIAFCSSVCCEKNRGKVIHRSCYTQDTFLVFRSIRDTVRREKTLPRINSISHYDVLVCYSAQSKSLVIPCWKGREGFLK